MKRILPLLSAAIIMSGCTSMNYKAKVKQELPVLGHRNWIVVADSAYPKQSAPGIETVYTGAKQLDVLAYVLDAIKDADHVSAVVMVDSELDSVSEKDAPGVSAYRKELKSMLKGRQVNSMPHEQIISKLDKDSKLFNILLLKTDLTIPYTSVFIRLDCGYWNAEKEARLRQAIKKQH